MTNGRHGGLQTDQIIYLNKSEHQRYATMKKICSKSKKYDSHIILIVHLDPKR